MTDSLERVSLREVSTSSQIRPRRASLASPHLLSREVPQDLPAPRRRGAASAGTGPASRRRRDRAPPPRLVGASVVGGDARVNHPIRAGPGSLRLPGSTPGSRPLLSRSAPRPRDHPAGGAWEAIAGLLVIRSDHDRRGRNTVGLGAGHESRREASASRWGHGCPCGRTAPLTLLPSPTRHVTSKSQST
jgi:hypothetical protein